jgi:hypothetical protein
MRLAMPPIMLQRSPLKHTKSLTIGSCRTATSSFGALLQRHHPIGPIGPHLPAEEADADGRQHGPQGGPGGAHASADPGKPRKTPEAEAALDPAARHAAHLAPPVASPQGPAPVEAEAEAIATRARTSLEDLLPALVRKVAWSGDGKRGTVHLELGSGPLAGGKLLIQAEEGRVRVHLSAPDGAGLAAWRERIAQRLEARGLVIDQIDVE